MVKKAAAQRRAQSWRNPRLQLDLPLEMECQGLGIWPEITVLGNATNTLSLPIRIICARVASFVTAGARLLTIALSSVNISPPAQSPFAL